MQNHKIIIDEIELLLKKHFEANVQKYSAVLFGNFVKDIIVQMIQMKVFYLKEFALTIFDEINNSEVDIECPHGEEEKEIKLFLDWFNRGDNKPIER